MKITDLPYERQQKIYNDFFDAVTRANRAGNQHPVTRHGVTFDPNKNALMCFSAFASDGSRLDGKDRDLLIQRIFREWHF